MKAAATRTPRYWAVLASAGGGSRMGLGKPKQYLPLRGRALLEWSLAPFLDAGWIDGVVLVLPKADSEFAKLPIACSRDCRCWRVCAVRRSRLCSCWSTTPRDPA